MGECWWPVERWGVGGGDEGSELNTVWWSDKSCAKSFSHKTRENMAHIVKPRIWDESCEFYRKGQGIEWCKYTDWITQPARFEYEGLDRKPCKDGWAIGCHQLQKACVWHQYFVSKMVALHCKRDQNINQKCAMPIKHFGAMAVCLHIPQRYRLNVTHTAQIWAEELWK